MDTYPKIIKDAEVKLYKDGTLVVILPHEIFCNGDRVMTTSDRYLWCRTFYEEGDNGNEKDN